MFSSSQCLFVCKFCVWDSPCLDLTSCRMPQEGTRKNGKTICVMTSYSIPENPGAFPTISGSNSIYYEHSGGLVHGREGRKTVNRLHARCNTQ